jgi:pilus assembly protein CpaC
VPIVLGDGRIRLEVEPEVSNLDPAAGTTIQGTNVPGRATQRVHTTVELEDSQTFVIGGLIQNTVLGSTTKVPVLGDIPFLGVAFSRKEFEEHETELIVMVTPHLVDPMDCSQAPKVLPGMETRRPDDFELFLEGILEAPRGQREVCPGGIYRAPYKNGPSASVFPCGVNNGCGTGSCGAGCANGCGGVIHASSAAPSPTPQSPTPLPRAAIETTPAPLPKAAIETTPAPLPAESSAPASLPPAAGDSGTR